MPGGMRARGRGAGGMRATHAPPPCEQNDRRLRKYYLAVIISFDITLMGMTTLPCMHNNELKISRGGGGLSASLFISFGVFLSSTILRVC